MCPMLKAGVRLNSKTLLQLAFLVALESRQNGSCWSDQQTDICGEGRCEKLREHQHNVLLWLGIHLECILP